MNSELWHVGSLVPGPGIPAQAPCVGSGKLEPLDPQESRTDLLWVLFPSPPLPPSQKTPSPHRCCVFIHGIFQKSGKLILGNVNKSSFIYLFCLPSYSLLGALFWILSVLKPSPCEIKHEGTKLPTKGLPPPGSQRRQPSPTSPTILKKRIAYLAALGLGWHSGSLNCDMRTLSCMCGSPEISQPGLNPSPLHWRRQILNHWTNRKSLVLSIKLFQSKTLACCVCHTSHC